ncbi:KLTH0G05324p [Lachancea thermotolerans CBS 6340]|uniref:KLTH0G05324p n=1 Tax=Lachancea thermotolerans (strain ATCC 56472 / CBS 6340 / NRRL Y-8284) TaxID=559295 RepID=C5DM22_LACTC|nr:KLTH0G05324p [Lachancea thermotolerans CBS 6340]CAR24833.1 KLTH0G05324p [Lachancea thermotolerans CBS 6340]
MSEQAPDEKVPSSGSGLSEISRASSEDAAVNGAYGSEDARDVPPSPIEGYQEDLGEVVVGIRHLLDGNESLNSQVSQMDLRLTQTQLNLEGLVTRSTNNNKHLKSLLMSSQDVRRLEELIQQLARQQDAAVAAQEHAREREPPEHGAAAEVQRLNEELGRFKEQHGSLEALGLQVVAKKQELAVLETRCASATARLHERAEDLQKLRQDHLELDMRIDYALREKYKAVETNLALSAATFTQAGRPPVTKMNRITSMLRNQHTNGRRVVSLNVADNYGFTPSNNSDDGSD